MSHPFHPLDSGGEERTEVIFYQTLRQSPEEREAFLEAECSGDPRLRAVLEAMLRDHAEAGTFLSSGGPLSAALEAELALNPPELAGGRIGSYKLLQQIGEGGCGVVWMAEQEMPVRRRVALKVIKLGMDTKQVIARFEAERQALAMMEHPNIARVLDAGATETGRPYFVMELVRGIKITTYCDQNNLTTEARLGLFTQVCQAIQHAHQKGIIHRDIKPSNILVTLHDGVPVPKVIDFGIAKATTGQQLTDKTIFTAFEQFIGTPAYMSPEQAEMSGLDIDTRSDIYALGVLLYELLTGRTPFDAKELLASGLDAMRRTIREQEPQRPSTRLSTLLAADQTTVAKQRQSDAGKLTNSLRGDLDWIVMKALEKDRTRRYESASSLAQEIQRHLNNEPVTARPPGNFYRFRKLVRRNKLAFGAAAGIAIAILVGSGVSVWQALRANTALADLRSSAPAFAALARMLAGTEKFDEAVENLDIAIRLSPDEPAYILTKANLLRSQHHFESAAEHYRNALQMEPDNEQAKRNAALCEKLAGEVDGKGQLQRASQLELMKVMTAEQRPAAELLRTGRLLGGENKLLLRHWTERLKDLPIPPAKPLSERLTADENGLLKLDLSGTDITDLSPLAGMPLERLVLEGCENVTDLSPLRGMPLRELALGYIRVRGSELDYSRKPCQVDDLAPLRGMPLEDLDLSGTNVVDLSPLQNMPLQALGLVHTRVSDLSPLKGMPLRMVVCNQIAAVDFSALAGAPLTLLQMESTGVLDLSFLRGMPLKELYLEGCEAARGYSVLSELKELEALTLPYDFLLLPKEEVTAIEALRQSPNLRTIGADNLGAGRASSKDEFWKSYDLLKIAGGDRRRVQRDATGWQVNFESIPLENLSMLQGLPVSRLNITGSGVSDLSPLKGMPLTMLYVGSNKLTDLTPLAELAITKLFLDQCPPGLDVTPLAKITTLQSLVLPPQARNIETLRQLQGLKYLSEEFEDGYKRALQTTDEFWSQKYPVTPGSLAREGKFAEAEKLLREQKHTTGPGKGVGYGLGVVVFAQQNEPAWQALCREMMNLARGDTVNKGPGFDALRVCLLGPNCGVPATELEELRTAQRKLWGGDTLFALTEGLQQFRAGSRERAHNILLRIRGTSTLPHARATCDTILAMIRCADGQRDYAKQTLARAREEMRGKWPERARAGIWYEWLTVHLLMKEAEAMIDGNTTGQESQ